MNELTKLLEELKNFDEKEVFDKIGFKIKEGDLNENRDTKS